MKLEGQPFNDNPIFSVSKIRRSIVSVNWSHLHRKTAAISVISASESPKLFPFYTWQKSHSSNLQFYVNVFYLCLRPFIQPQFSDKSFVPEFRFFLFLKIFFRKWRLIYPILIINSWTSKAVNVENSAR